MRISDWSSDVFSSDLTEGGVVAAHEVIGRQSLELECVLVGAQLLVHELADGISDCQVVLAPLVHQMRSMMVPEACAPPAHMETSSVCASRRSRSCWALVRDRKRVG